MNEQINEPIDEEELLVGPITKPVDLGLQSFELPPEDGGTQVILAHKQLSDVNHYVFTFGVPDVEHQDENAEKAKRKFSLPFAKNAMKKSAQNDADYDLSKQGFRCFKLAAVGENQYDVEEYLSARKIAQAARKFLGEPENEPEPEL